LNIGYWIKGLWLLLLQSLKIQFLQFLSATLQFPQILQPLKIHRSLQFLKSFLYLQLLHFLLLFVHL
jgi:hypothetical protein